MIAEIINSLQIAYEQPVEKGNRKKIIFWFDREREFIGQIEAIKLENVRIHILREINYLTLRVMAEADECTYVLVYCDMRVSMQDIWLIDTFLYSPSFYPFNLSLGTIDEKLEMEIFSEFYALYPIDSMKRLRHYWKYVEKLYGFQHGDAFFTKLYTYLSISALSLANEVQYLTTIKGFAEIGKQSKPVICIDQWKQHGTDSRTYTMLADCVERELNQVFAFS